MLSWGNKQITFWFRSLNSLNYMRLTIFVVIDIIIFYKEEIIFLKKLKLADLKVTSFLTSLPEDEKAKIKGGDGTIYPCEISAPQIICNTDPEGYTCATCYNTCIGCGGGVGSTQ